MKVSLYLCESSKTDSDGVPTWSLIITLAPKFI